MAVVLSSVMLIWFASSPMRCSWLVPAGRGTDHDRPVPINGACIIRTDKRATANPSLHEYIELMARCKREQLLARSVHLMHAINSKLDCIGDFPGLEHLDIDRPQRYGKPWCHSEQYFVRPKQGWCSSKDCLVQGGGRRCKERCWQFQGGGPRVPSSKSKAPRILNDMSSCHVAAYHMPLCRCCHSRLPSTGMSSMDVESPGIPFSLNAEVWWASNDICADMSCRSTEPSSSSDDRDHRHHHDGNN